MTTWMYLIIADRTFKCDYCGLTGTVPGEWNPLWVTSLSLRGNFLTGSIPSTWSRFFRGIAYVAEILSTLSARES